MLDGERVRAKAPTYTVFNGRYNGLVDKPLAAKPGERVRMFVMNVGPSNTSSFHVVGTIFDRVWIDGNPDNQFRGMQTVLLGLVDGAIVEFIIPEAGNYVMVDHHFANASQGAIGLSPPTRAARATREPSTTTSRPPRCPRTPRRSRASSPSRPSASPATRSAAATRWAPTSTASRSHATTRGSRAGSRTRTRCCKTDADAKEMLAKYKVPMPNQNLADEDIKEIIAYFKWADENIHVHDKAQPHAAPDASKPASETLSASRPADGGKK